MLPVLGALTVGTVARYMAAFTVGALATSEVGREILGGALVLTGRILQAPGRLIELIGKEIDPTPPFPPELEMELKSSPPRSFPSETSPGQSFPEQEEPPVFIPGMENSKGTKLKPEEDVALKQVVGDLLVRLHEAEKSGEISTERKREVMTGLSLYLVQAGVKPEDLYDYMREAVEARVKGEIEPKLEEEIEKVAYQALSYVEAQAMKHGMRRSV